MQQLAQDKQEPAEDAEKPDDSTDEWGTGSTAVLEPPRPDAPTEDCGEDCVANAREEQDLLHRLRRDQRIHLGMFNQKGRNPEMHPAEDDAGGQQLEAVLTQSGFPATESGPFGPAKYLTGFGENERNTAPLSALSLLAVAPHSNLFLKSHSSSSSGSLNVSIHSLVELKTNDSWIPDNPD